MERKMQLLVHLNSGVKFYKQSVEKRTKIVKICLRPYVNEGVRKKKWWEKETRTRKKQKTYRLGVE